MKKTAIIKKYFLICMVIVLANLMAYAALSQTHRRYEEHEVIDVGNGMKIEVLKYRGEGENEECNVIYYTDKRQNGKRVWEKTGKIIEMERAAKLTAAQQVHVSKRLLETPIESTSNSEAEAINLAEEKLQQDERQKSKSEMIPKAVMKPNTTSKTKTTYTGRNTNLITAATQMLAANEPSNPSNTSARRRADTAKIIKTKSSLPAKTTIVASPKKR